MIWVALIAMPLLLLVIVRARMKRRAAAREDVRRRVRS